MSESTRWSIIEGLKDGRTIKELAQEFNVHRRTVGRLKKRFLAKGSVDYLPILGRKVRLMLIGPSLNYPLIININKKCDYVYFID